MKIMFFRNIIKISVEWLRQLKRRTSTPMIDGSSPTDYKDQNSVFKAIDNIILLRYFNNVCNNVILRKKKFLYFLYCI